MEKIPNTTPPEREAVHEFFEFLAGIRGKIALMATLAVMSGCNDIMAGSERIQLTDPGLDSGLEQITSSFLNDEITKEEAKKQTEILLKAAGIDPRIQTFQKSCHGQGEFCGYGAGINRNLAASAYRNGLIKGQTRQYGPRKR